MTAGTCTARIPHTATQRRRASLLRAGRWRNSHRSPAPPRDSVPEARPAHRAPADDFTAPATSVHTANAAVERRRHREERLSTQETLIRVRVVAHKGAVTRASATERDHHPLSRLLEARLGDVRQAPATPPEAHAAGRREHTTPPQDTGVVRRHGVDGAGDVDSPDPGSRFGQDRGADAHGAQTRGL